MGTHVHRLIEKSADTLRGVCAHCGEVPLVMSSGSLRCSFGREQGRHRERRYRSRSAKHGLYMDEAKTLRDSRPCDICGNRAEAVDHDHESGAIRGVLCVRCNTSIGRFQDRADLLRAAADYLDNPPGR